MTQSWPNLTPASQTFITPCPSAAGKGSPWETQTQTLLIVWGHVAPAAQRKSFSGDVQMQAVGAETQEAREGPSEQWKCPRGCGWSPTVSTTLGTLTPGRTRYQERLP